MDKLHIIIDFITCKAICPISCSCLRIHTWDVKSLQEHYWSVKDLFISLLWITAKYYCCFNNCCSRILKMPSFSWQNICQGRVIKTCKMKILKYCHHIKSCRTSWYFGTYEKTISSIKHVMPYSCLYNEFVQDRSVYRI